MGREIYGAEQLHSHGAAQTDATAQTAYMLSGTCCSADSCLWSQDGSQGAQGIQYSHLHATAPHSRGTACRCSVFMTSYLLLQTGPVAHCANVTEG